MNEAEYLHLQHPQVLLERTARWSCGWVTETSRCPAATERKLRLIAAGCGRFFRDELGGEVPLELVEAAERFSESDAEAGAVLNAGGRWNAYAAAVLLTPARDAAVAALRMTL